MEEKIAGAPARPTPCALPTLSPNVSQSASIPIVTTPNPPIQKQPQSRPLLPQTVIVEVRDLPETDVSTASEVESDFERDYANNELNAGQVPVQGIENVEETIVHLHWDGATRPIIPLSYECDSRSVKCIMPEKAGHSLCVSFKDIEMSRNGLTIAFNSKHYEKKLNKESEKKGKLIFRSEEPLQKLLKLFHDYHKGGEEAWTFEVDSKFDRSKISIRHEEKFGITPTITLNYLNDANVLEIIDTKYLDFHERRTPHGLSYVIGKDRKNEIGTDIYDVIVTCNYTTSFQLKMTQSEWNSDQAHNYLYAEHEKTKVQKAELEGELLKVQRECTVLKQQLDIKPSMSVEEGDSLKMEVRRVREENNRLKEEVESGIDKMKRTNRHLNEAMQVLKEQPTVTMAMKTDETMRSMAENGMTFASAAPVPSGRLLVSVKMDPELAETIKEITAQATAAAELASNTSGQGADQNDKWAEFGEKMGKLGEKMAKIGEKMGKKSASNK